MRRFRRTALGAALLALTLLGSACAGDESGGGEDQGASPKAQKGSIAVGVSGAFAESQLVAEMYAQVLENAGYEVERQLNLEAREVSDSALFSGEIDVKPEYLAFELPKLDESADTTGTAEEVYPRVQDAAAAKDLVALTFSPANSTNAIVVTPDTADQHGLSTTSDLAPVASELSFGAPPDCDTNYACAEGLKEVYGIEFAEIKSLDFGGPQTVAAVKSGAVDVGELFTLDPTITQEGFVVLEDDKDLQPAGNFFALIRQDALNDEVEQLLDSVTTSLTTEGMLELVGRVQVDQEDVSAVAESFLTDAGLL
jgi:osmoprotectant transport system substrate-binding protein